MEKLESAQYSATLAVTGTWRGTSRANLYAELGWESLNLRPWSRRLTLLYKIVNNLTPSYMTEPIPPLQQSNYTLRSPDAIWRIRARTENSSLVSILVALLNGMNWTQRLDLHRLSLFLRKNFCQLSSPPAKSVFGIHDPMGLSHLTQLRVGLGKLNFHRFRHNFKDTVKPNVPYERWC